MEEENKKYSRIRTIWYNMISRCTNYKTPNYYRYGGRGIKVCDEWLNSFEAFESWALANGYRDDLTIDRIDNNGNYEPSNCRWADSITQANNKSTNYNITYKGRTQTLAQWVRELNLDYAVTHHRLDEGWSIEDAFEKPQRFDGVTELTYNNKTQSIIEWAKETGMTYNTIKHRHDKGLPVNEILETPQKEHDVTKTYYKGEYKSLREWGRVLNISLTTILYRLNTLHMSVEEAFETPVKAHTKDIEYNGKIQSMTAWAHELGIPEHVMMYRVKAGWSMDKIVSTPVRERKAKNA